MRTRRNFGPVVVLQHLVLLNELLQSQVICLGGLGAGVLPMLTNYPMPRAIQADRVWVNQYNTYPAYAPLSVLKNLIGRENHKMALDHYRVVVKNMIILRQRAS
jgi:aldehyde dehydrogenase (NAD+)/aldehyde dehydrogenase